MNCLVTGAASGLGLATATRLAKAGANVVLADLASNRSQLESITADLGPSTLAACMDVTKPAEVEAALDECEARFGTVNALVSCAGIAVASRTVSKKGAHSLDDFSRVLHVNTTGTFNVLRLAAERYVFGANEGSNAHFLSFLCYQILTEASISCVFYTRPIIFSVTQMLLHLCL